ncbi:MAG: alpha-L-fucosidase [Bacteroidales bacterium]|nr:alpha-L-fucosidase [Bacteroidales bacterium]
MKRLSTFIAAICVMANLNCAFAQTEADFYQREYPSWFADAKLGIFVHYGLYSVPAWSGAEQYAEWFYKGLISNDTARINFQKRVYGEDFKYEDYKNLLRAELFNADDWARLFKKSGAKYVVFTSKHHDGYCLWDSKFAKGWNSVETAPKRDFCKELSEAVRKQDLKFGLYYSLLEWNNPLFAWTQDSVGVERYVKEHLQPQFKELVDNFKPSLVFADGDWDFDYRTLESEQMVQYYYDVVGDEAIVNNRWGVGFNHGYLTPEYSSGIKEQSRPWAECRGLSRSFGLNRNADLSSYMTSEELILHFVSLVAAGGGLTLNVSPSADGQIPLLQQERLLDLGDWLETNGEAIYGTKPYDGASGGQIEANKYDKDSIINYDWARNAPMKGMTEDNFAVSWLSKITPKYSEEYTIYLTADDKATIEIREVDTIIKSEFVTKTILIDSTLLPNEPRQLDIKLYKNKKYVIWVYYEETDLNASVSLQWESKHTPKEFIKADWDAYYNWNVSEFFFTQKNKDIYVIVNSDLLTSEIEFSLPKVPKGDMKITFLESKFRPISWMYRNGNLIINTQYLYKFVRSKGAVAFKLENYLAD